MTRRKKITTKDILNSPYLLLAGGAILLALALLVPGPNKADASDEVNSVQFESWEDMEARLLTDSVFADEHTKYYYETHGWDCETSKYIKDNGYNFVCYRNG